MANLKVFAERMRRRAKKVEKNVDKSVIVVAGRALQSVVLRTPVDTGRARGGWTVGINSPPNSGTLLDPSGGAAIAVGRARMQSRRNKQSIYISNNVEYIGNLNDGSSAQAPANFVEIGVREAVATVRNVKVVD